jgi:hypothetical protein
MNAVSTAFAFPTCVRLHGTLVCPSFAHEGLPAALTVRLAYRAMVARANGVFEDPIR